MNPITQENLERARQKINGWVNTKCMGEHLQECDCLLNIFAKELQQSYERGLEAASDELEKAFKECDTYNLLHGAARVRALKEDGGRK